jgi:hypothetical protein
LSLFAFFRSCGGTLVEVTLKRFWDVVYTSWRLYCLKRRMRCKCLALLIYPQQSRFRVLCNSRLSMILNRSTFQVNKVIIQCAQVPSTDLSTTKRSCFKMPGKTLFIKVKKFKFQEAGPCIHGMEVSGRDIVHMQVYVSAGLLGVLVLLRADLYHMRMMCLAWIYPTRARRSLYTRTSCRRSFQVVSCARKIFPIAVRSTSYKCNLSTRTVANKVSSPRYLDSSLSTSYF